MPVKTTPKSDNYSYSRRLGRGIDVTVAAIIEREGRFLMVEERAAGNLVLNQPAGHLEQGESLLTAIVRETIEETGHHFEPTHIVGFCGTAEPSADVATLDEGIVAVYWLTRAQLLSKQRQLRSPMVMRCLDDYLAGRRYSLDCLSYLDPRSLARSQPAYA
jgi:8-oxo-dGTP pyrophosphatase MutT (NUDIX family)